MTVNNGKPEMTNITPEYAAIGQRMRLIRKRKNLTQRGMGQILGMSGATVCQNENGVFSGMKYLEHFAVFVVPATNAAFLIYNHHL